MILILCLNYFILHGIYFVVYSLSPSLSLLVVLIPVVSLSSILLVSPIYSPWFYTQTLPPSIPLSLLNSLCLSLSPYSSLGAFPYLLLILSYVLLFLCLSFSVTVLSLSSSTFLLLSPVLFLLDLSTLHTLLSFPNHVMVLCLPHYYPICFTLNQIFEQ